MRCRRSRLNFKARLFAAGLRPLSRCALSCLQTSRIRRHTRGAPQQSKVRQNFMVPFAYFSALAQSWRSASIAALPCLLVLVFCSASVPAQDDVLTTDTSLVQLSVGVVDKTGHAITNLSQNDFAVFENGQPRPIVHFEPADAPFSL